MQLHEQAVVIGASAGALEALSVLLPALPADFPAPVMLVVHVPPDKDSLLSEILSPRCQLGVMEAEDKQPLEAGNIYIAPPNYHLLVETEKCLSLSNDEPVMYSRPSIDLLFESAADAYEEQLTGIVLTGANSDGAAGLAAIVEAGGRAIVQQPEEAMAAAMPQAALKACPSATELALEEIAPYLIAAVKKGGY
ncbi:MAG: chemotaxis protein CheB [Rickettsiales bacterium]|nr:chemotaxis protein CheB [Rickettsiales bacterium]|tara:strand:+ start:2267 stop:2848 length:582 start_codon:yes stop_codon:yes gene_type:complete